MVKPGGTGSPIEVMSARFAPLPPRSCFWLAFPSVPDRPKKYTILTPLRGVGFLRDVLARRLGDFLVVAMIGGVLPEALEAA